MLVRHGQTPTTGAVLPGRAKGLHLSEAGVKQAERAGERLGALDRVAAVYASPMERTQETAAPIARACGKRVRTAAGLIECDFGSWTGRKLAELRKLPEWETVQRYPSGFRFPKGESFAEMQARMVGCLSELVAAHPAAVVHACKATGDTPLHLLLSNARQHIPKNARASRTMTLRLPPPAS